MQAMQEYTHDTKMEHVGEFWIRLVSPNAVNMPIPNQHEEPQQAWEQLDANDAASKVAACM